MDQGPGEAISPEPVCAVGKVPNLPLAFTPQAGPLLVPSSEQFQLAREQTKEAGKTQELHRMVSAMQVAAAKSDLASRKLLSFAVFRLEVERDSVACLGQHVRHGEDRSRCRSGILLGDASAIPGDVPAPGSDRKEPAGLGARP